MQSPRLVQIVSLLTELTLMAMVDAMVVDSSLGSEAWAAEASA